MMNKKLLIGGAVVLIGGLVGATYVIKNKKKNNTVEESPQDQGVEVEEEVATEPETKSQCEETVYEDDIDRDVKIEKSEEEVEVINEESDEIITDATEEEIVNSKDDREATKSENDILKDKLKRLNKQELSLIYEEMMDKEPSENMTKKQMIKAIMKKHTN